MPRPLLRKVPIHELASDMQAAHAKSTAIRGDATFFEVFANHPELYRWYTGSFYGEVFRGGIVERRIKELIRLRLSMKHGCRFCNQGNRLDALDAGLSDVDIANLDHDVTVNFNKKEQAALHLADEFALTNSSGSLTPALYKDLRQSFSDAEILELGLVMGVLSGMAKFMFAFDLVEREDNCPFPHSGA